MRNMTSIAALGICLISIGSEATGGERRMASGGIYTETQSARGALLFETHCSHCHGRTLAGGAVNAAWATKRDGTPLLAPPLVMAEFAWTGHTIADYTDAIGNLMPLDSPGVLSRQQVADVAAFLLKANGYPSGASELPSVRALQDEVFLDRAR